jgi:hypothetical protein
MTQRCKTGAVRQWTQLGATGRGQHDTGVGVRPAAGHRRHGGNRGRCRRSSEIVVMLQPTNNPL